MIWFYFNVKKGMECNFFFTPLYNQWENNLFLKVLKILRFPFSSLIFSFLARFSIELKLGL